MMLSYLYQAEPDASRGVRRLSWRGCPMPQYCCGKLPVHGSCGVFAHNVVITNPNSKGRWSGWPKGRFTHCKLYRCGITPSGVPVS